MKNPKTFDDFLKEEGPKANLIVSIFDNWGKDFKKKPLAERQAIDGCLNSIKNEFHRLELIVDSSPNL